MQKILISPLLYTALVPFGMILQIILIQIGAPRWLYSLLPIVITLFDPLVFECSPYIIYGCFTCHKTYNFLRMMDIALLPSQVVRNWSLIDYVEYFYTFYTKKMRLELKAQGKRAGSKYVVLPKDRTPGYYGRWAWKMLLQYIFLHLLEYYSLQYPPDRNPPVRTFANLLHPKQVLDNTVFGLRLCLLLSLNYNFAFHLSCALLNSPFEPIMNAPFYSRSFRDFWSNRWNAVVKENLHRLAFKPTVQFLQFIWPCKRKGIPSSYTFIGAFMTFFFSAVLHEWMVLALMKSPTTWESFWFFIIHGCVTMTEVAITKVCVLKYGFDPITCAPYWVGWLTTTILFLLTTPFFINPWIREDILGKLRIPTVFDFMNPHAYFQ